MSENNLNINNEPPAEVLPEESHKKRRERIKTILIIFLAVLLVLTFFSNTIMNRSLPEIATESCTSGTLTERLRGNGIVESNQSYDVIVDENKNVETIHIKTGQSVNKGDVLFTLSAGQSAELEEAESALKALELEYQKALLTVPKDYATENAQIKNTREDLQTLVTRRDQAVAMEGAIAELKAQYNDCKIQLQLKSDELAKYQGYISSIDMNDFSSLPAEHSGSLIEIQNSLNEARTALDAAKQKLSDLQASNAAKEQIDSAQAEVDAAQSKYDNFDDSLNSFKSSVRSALTAEMNAVESDVTSLTAAVASYESQLSSDSAVSASELDEQIVAKQRELENLLIALEQAKKENNATEQIESITLQSQKDEIDKQKKKIEKLKQDTASTDVTAKYSGVVSQINIRPGEATVPETPIAVIDISDEGYTVKISVDAEKTKKIKVGNEAEILNNWDGGVTATLSEIKSSSEGGQKQKTLVFTITGAVESGQNLELSIPCGSGKYDAIVPKSAVREDKNGKFVLTVRSKSTPLGNRYYAERISVNVEASDDVSSAVSGGISAGDFIITTSSKPIEPDDQVRMKD